MIDYSVYNTDDPFRSVDFDLIYEGRGIPNLIKTLNTDILNDIVGNEYNFSKNYDLNSDNFNVLLNVSIINTKRRDIYATSKFGVYSENKMSGSNITIYMDITNYDSVGLKRVITHELLHIYEIFNRIKGGTKMDLQWGLSSFLQDLRSKYKSKFISDFIYLMYLSLDQEINARVSEVYSILIESRSSDKDILEDELRKTSAWGYSNDLLNFNYNLYQIDYDEFFKFSIDLNTLILDKYGELNFNIYKVPTSKLDCKKIIKSWVSIFRKKGRNFRSKLLKIIDEVIVDVKMIESAYVYVDNSLIGEWKTPYILSFDKYLERESKIYKIIRK